MANMSADHIAEAVKIALELVSLQSRIRARACLLGQSFTGAESFVWNKESGRNFHQLSSRLSDSYISIIAANIPVFT